MRTYYFPAITPILFNKGLNSTNKKTVHSLKLISSLTACVE